MSEANGELLPTGWIRTSLDEIVTPRSGKVHPKTMPKAQFIGMEQIEPETMRLLGTVPAGTMKSSANSFQPGDVLYGRLRPYLNKVYQPDFSGLCSGEFIVIPDSCAVSGRFLKYRINAADFVRFASRLNTGDRPRVDFDQLGVFEIDLPPKNEQQRIAGALDELLSDLDAGVAALERARVKLGHYRAAVLKAAVDGSLTADWRKQHPDAESASELLKRILLERRKRWEQEQLRKYAGAGKQLPANWKAKYKEPFEPATNGLPELPDGWCWATLDQVFHVQRGRFLVRPRGDPRYYGGEMPFVQIGDLPREGGEIRSYSQTLNAAGIQISRAFPAGTVLAAIVGATIGNTGILTFESCCPDSLVALTAAPAAMLRYAELYLRSQKLWVRNAASASGGQPNINLEFLQPFVIPLPGCVEVEAILEAAEDQLSVIDYLEADLDAKLKSAQSLRQSILRQAFSGKLVPQDPSDEPAAELLKRIAAERAERERSLAVEKRTRQAKKPKRKTKAKRGS